MITDWIGKGLMTGAPKDAAIIQMLSYDIVSAIISFMPLEYVMDEEIISMLFPLIGADICQITHDRFSVQMYLKQLVLDSSKLIEMMLLTHTTLVGPRAIGFFLPTVLYDDSEWIFYCGGGSNASLMFFQYMKQIGLQANKCKECGASDKCKTSHANDTVIETKMKLRGDTIPMTTIKCNMRKDGIYHRVSIVDIQFTSELYMMSLFSRSIYQCFISGFAAVSLQSSVTQNSISIDMRSTSLISDPISFDICEQYITNVKAQDTSDAVSRNIYDEHSWFDRYDYHMEHSPKISTIMRKAFDIVSSMTWYEHVKPSESHISMRVLNMHRTYVPGCDRYQPLTNTSRTHEEFCKQVSSKIFHDMCDYGIRADINATNQYNVFERYWLYLISSYRITP